VLVEADAQNFRLTWIVFVNTYSHVLPALQQEAAREMDAVLTSRRT
jgi:hypothetical protein